LYIDFKKIKMTEGKRGLERTDKRGIFKGTQRGLGPFFYFLFIGFL